MGVAAADASIVRLPVADAGAGRTADANGREIVKILRNNAAPLTPPEIRKQLRYYGEHLTPKRLYLLLMSAYREGRIDVAGREGSVRCDRPWQDKKVFSEGRWHTREEMALRDLRLCNKRSSNNMNPENWESAAKHIYRIPFRAVPDRLVDTVKLIHTEGILSE